MIKKTKEGLFLSNDILNVMMMNDCNDFIIERMLDGSTTLTVIGIDGDINKIKNIQCFDKVDDFKDICDICRNPASVNVNGIFYCGKHVPNDIV